MRGTARFAVQQRPSQFRCGGRAEAARRFIGGAKQRFLQLARDGSGRRSERGAGTTSAAFPGETFLANAAAANDEINVAPPVRAAFIQAVMRAFAPHVQDVALLVLPGGGNYKALIRRVHAVDSALQLLEHPRPKLRATEAIGGVGAW